MEKIFFVLLEFLIISIIVYILYYIFMISKYDKEGKLKKKKSNTIFTKIGNYIKKFLGFNNEKDEILNRGKKPKKIKKDQDDIKIPTEVEILILKYHIDLSKINYKKLLKLVGLMCALDIGLVMSIISLITVENIYIKIGIGGICIIPIVLIGYSILGNYLKKKGLVVKNEKGNKTNKRNRK